MDAAQLAAHRETDMAGSGIDYLVLSGHKMYAPFGTGLLVARKGMLTFNQRDFEEIRSSGEENVAGIAALGKAMNLLDRIGMERIMKEEQVLTASLLKGMSGITGIRLYGVQDPDAMEFERKGGIVVFGIKGILPARIAKELSLYSGIGIRFGCHCSHMLIKHLLGISPGLEKFQKLIVTLFPGITLPGLARVSLGLENTEEDVDAFIAALDQIARKTHPVSFTLRRRDAVEKAYKTGSEK